MGQLYYGDTEEPIDIPDRLLAHPQGRYHDETATLRELHPHVAAHAERRSGAFLALAAGVDPLRFVFEESEPEQLDGAALQDMAHRATSSSGLVVDFDDLPAAPARQRLEPVA